MTVFWLLLAVLVIAVLQNRIFHRWGLRRLQYRRYFTRDAVFAGEELQMVEVIENRKPLPLPWLRVESRMPGSLRFGGAQGKRTAPGEDSYHNSLFAMGPFRRIQRVHRVKATRRGYFPLETVNLSLGDGLGLNTVSRSVPCPNTLVVYPTVLDENVLQVASHRWQGEVILRRFIEPDPYLINGIRPFMRGDSLRDVHWHSSARTGELQVKTRDYTASPKLYLLLNIQCREDQWGETLDKKQAAQMEYALQLCATYAAWAAKNHVEMAFGCNGRYGVLDDTAVEVPFGMGEAHFYEMLRTMARVLLRRRKAFPSYLDDIIARGVTGADIVIVSPYWSNFIEERAQTLRAMGNAVQYAPVLGEVSDEAIS